MVWPGPMTVKSLFEMATVGVHLTLTPPNLAAEPSAATMPNTLVFQWGVKIELGSLRRVSDSSPLFVQTVLRLKLSTSVMVSAPIDKDWVSGEKPQGVKYTYQ